MYCYKVPDIWQRTTQIEHTLLPIPVRSGRQQENVCMHHPTNRTRHAMVFVTSALNGTKNSSMGP